MNEELKVTPKMLEEIYDACTHSFSKLVQVAGIELPVLEERHVRMEMPLGDVHRNHVGTAYAVSMVMLMESAGATLIQATWGNVKFVPILSSIEINYQKPTRNTLVCDVSLTQEEADKLIAPILERGRGRCPLHIKLTDSEGSDIAEADYNFYLLPNAPQKG